MSLQNLRNTVAAIRNDWKGVRDAFGRTRVSDPQTLFDFQAEYDNGPLFWNEVTAGSATIAHNADEAGVDMTVTTSDGDVAIRQTKQYIRYQPGKSQLCLFTFVLAPGETNLIQRVGYFDQDNGIFFELNGTNQNIVLRTNTSGSPVETTVTGGQWNGEDVGLDPTKANIFWIDLEWLGVGQVRTGFVIDGEFRVAHTFKNANNTDKVYMRTANLPARFEIRNDGATGGATLQAICTSIISEGGFEEDRGIPFSVANELVYKAVGTTPIPVISIQPKTTFNSVTNRSQIIVRGVDGLSVGDNVYVQVIYDGTLTGANWQSVDSNSVVNVDTSATSITGGQKIQCFYLEGGTSGQTRTGGSGTQGLLSKLPLALTVSASAESNLSVVVGASASANVAMSIFWQELK